MRQSQLKYANIFSSWLTARRVIRCETFHQTCFSVCLFPCFFCLSVSQILSLTLPGEQSSMCWPSTGNENRSNHLFIDWNIRGLRGSEWVGATKSGKDRLAEGWGIKRRVGAKWNWVEIKEGERNVEWTKSGPFCGDNKSSEHTNKRHDKWWKRNTNRDYSRW